MRTSSTVSNHHGSPESNRTFASAQSWSRSRANSSTVIWPTGNRPKTPTSGLVSQVGALIHRASKDALPRRFHEPHSVRRPKTICRSAHERLDPTYVGVAEAIEFRQLDNPNSAGLHGGVFAPQIRQFIGEVLVCQGPKCCGLANALRRSFAKNTPIRCVFGEGQVLRTLFLVIRRIKVTPTVLGALRATRAKRLGRDWL